MFHVELKYTSHGPRLIEVNCRMGGGPVRATNLLVWGVDLVEEQLLCSAGIPSRPPIAAKPLMYIAEYSVNAKVSGRILNIDFCKVRAHPISSAVLGMLRPGTHRLTLVCDLAGVGESPGRAVCAAACEQGPEGDGRDRRHADLGGGAYGEEGERRGGHRVCDSRREGIGDSCSAVTLESLCLIWVTCDVGILYEAVGAYGRGTHVVSRASLAAFGQRSAL